MELMLSCNGYVVVGVLRDAAAVGDIRDTWGRAALPDGQELLLTDETTIHDWRDQIALTGLESPLRHLEYKAKFFKAILI